MPGFDAVFLRWLLLSSASATAIAGVVVIVQIAFGRWLTPAGRQRLWLLVIIRLLLPILPASMFSIANLPFEKLWTTRHISTPVLHAAVEPEFETTIYIKPMPSSASTPIALPPTAMNTAPARSTWENLPMITLIIWGAVALAILLRLLQVNHRLAVRLRRARPIQNELTLKLLDNCMREAGVHRPVAVVETDAAATPAVYGIFRPRILMPTGLLQALTPPQQRHIILHELSHIRHHDVLANWMLSLLCIVHWFNPFLWFATSRLKADRELARDAWVIRRDDADDYADTLIDLAQRLSINDRSSWPRVATPLPALFGRGTSLRRRLHMIARSSNSHYGFRFIGVALLAILGPMVLTRAKAQSTPGEARSDIAPSTRPTLPGGRAPAATPATGDDDTERRWAIKDLTSLAKNAISTGKYEEALSIINKLAERDPGNMYVRQTRPLVLDKLGAAERGDLDANMVRVLARKLPAVHFDKVGLQDTVDFMRDVSGTNIFVNWKILENVGVNRTTPITATINNASFEKALNIILNSAGGGTVQLAFKAEMGLITISTRGDLQSAVVIRVYDIRDLLDAGDAKGRPLVRQERIEALTAQILDAVDTNSWRDRGGQVGSLRVFDPSGQLIVTQTPDNHRLLINLLDGMRQKMRIAAGTGGKSVEAEAALRRTLDRVLPAAHFDAVGFGDVIDYLRDISNGNIFVNWKVIEAAGVNRNTPVTANFHNVKFSKALDLVLDSVGGANVQLGYTVDNGIFTISTKRDLDKNVTVRVYDVRDLLRNRADTVFAADAGAQRNLRLEQLTKLIEDNVSTESWKDRGGDVAAIRAIEPGQMIITQTPDNHRNIVALLDRVRAERNVQILLEGEYYDCDSAQLSVEMKKWRAPTAIEQPTTRDGSRTLVLSKDLAQQIAALKNSGKFKQLASPGFTIMDGQQATVNTSTARTYIGDYLVVRDADGKTRYEPVKRNATWGVEVAAQAWVAGESTVRLSMHPKVTTFGGMTSKPWPNRPEGSNLLVDTPQLSVTEAEMSSKVGTDQTLVMVVAEQELGRSLLILVKPTIVRGANGNDVKPPFELKTNRQE